MQTLPSMIGTGAATFLRLRHWKGEFSHERKKNNLRNPFVIFFGIEIVLYLLPIFCIQRFT